MKFSIPQAVADSMETLQKSGYSSYLVGGSVRDLLMELVPKDWDVATNATPEEIQTAFPESVYENQFGTVAVKTGSEDPALAIVEITTFRTEEKYTDKRHPDVVRFTQSIEEDLARRDFTINAMAMEIKNEKGKSKNEIIDPYGAQEDLKNKIIRAVGKPGDRFREDALRLMRAVRFAAQLGFTIEPKTLAAIKENSSLIQAIAKERIRDEFIKIIETREPHNGIFLLQTTGLLRHILPELDAGVGVAQNKHHVYTVFEHNAYSLMYAATYGYGLAARIASLFHDVGKPQAKRGEGPEATFYNHDIVGARLTAKIMDRLRFPRDLSEKVVTLVRYHLFYYDVGVVTASSVRRLLRKVGPENIQELLQVRIAERKGSGVPKARPYRLRHLEFMLEKVQRDPISVGMLKADGNDVMQATGVKPGPRVGWILNALLEEVLDEPELNTREYLKRRINELHALSDTDLRALAEKGLEKKEAREEEAEGEIKARYWVK